MTSLFSSKCSWDFFSPLKKKSLTVRENMHMKWQNVGKYRENKTYPESHDPMIITANMISFSLLLYINIHNLLCIVFSNIAIKQPVPVETFFFFAVYQEHFVTSHAIVDINLNDCRALH